MNKVLIILCGLILIFPFNFKASETVSVLEEINLAQNAKSAILIEATTGKILFEKNSNEKLAPASMTKMMTMLLIVEAIESKILNWDDVIIISENASNMGGSQILLETGEQMAVSDLFKGIAIASANDAAVALGEAIAGTEEEFVKMMNDKVKELGLKNTNFKNSHGLDETNHYSSANDMAYIAKELVKHNKVLEYSSIYEDYLRKGTDKEFWLVNTNKLVRFNPIVDGLKTGYTEAAGYCLTATSYKNNMRLISVVMGEENTNKRNSEVSALLEYGYSKYKIENIIKKGEVVDTINLYKAKESKVEIVAKEDYNIVINKTSKLGKITHNTKIDEIKIPVTNGTKIGLLNIYENNKKIDSIDVTVKEDVKKANILDLYKKILKDIVVGNISFK